MAEEKLTLHGDKYWISPYVFTVFVSLKEKGLDFTTASVALDEKAQQEPKYYNGSITGRVPSLEHGSFWLAESSAIVEYLEDVFPAPNYKPLLPKDPKHRARARQILAWIRSDLLALAEERPTITMFYEKAKEPLSEKGQAAANHLFHAAELLIPEGEGPLFGEWCIADRLILNGDPVPERLKKYAQQQWQRPTVQEFVNLKRAPSQRPYTRISPYPWTKELNK